MHDREEYKNRIELLQGTLDLIILRASMELFQVDTGSLYLALHRLEKQGFVKSEWDVSENKQRAKYYKLTAVGRKQLSSEQSCWTRFVAAMEMMMKSSPTEG